MRVQRGRISCAKHRLCFGILEFPSYPYVECESRGKYSPFSTPFVDQVLECKTSRSGKEVPSIIRYPAFRAVTIRGPTARLATPLKAYARPRINADLIFKKIEYKSNRAKRVEQQRLYAASVRDARPFATLCRSFRMQFGYKLN
jgi:hypothetical protein